MTIKEIVKNVSRARKRALGKRSKVYTRQAIHKNLRKLGLKPLGQSRPAIYPAGADKKIILLLGFQNGGRS